MSARGFKQQRDRSMVYEIAFGLWLEQRGWYVLPAYDFSGLANDKAPRLTCNLEKLVVPDLLAFKGGKGSWFEIKLKERADLYRATNTRETGLPLRHYKDYEKIVTETGLSVWVIFIHEAEKVIKTGEVGKLPHSHTYAGSKMDRGGTIFFKFDELITVMSLEQLEKLIKKAA